MNRSNEVSMRFTRSVRTSLLALLLALFAGGTLAQDQDASQEPAVDPDAPVIELGEDETITQQQFSQEFERAMRMLALQQGVPYTDETRAAFDRFQGEFLRQYATQQALLREAEERDVTVTDEEIDQQIEGARESLGGDEAFNDVLGELGYDSVDAYRADVREGLTAQRVADSFAAEVEPTEDEIQAYYDENQASQFPERSLDEARTEVEQAIRSEALTARFDELRAQYGIETFPDRLNYSRADVPNATGPDEGAEETGEGEAAD